MPNRSHTFREIFRSLDPFSTEKFRVLSEKVAGGTDAQALQEFLIALNRELSETLGTGEADDVERARGLFRR